MANEANQAFRESEQEALEEAARDAVVELTFVSPIDTGELVRGIRAIKDQIVMPEHGMWIDRRRGRHTNWIGRATNGEVIY